MKLIVVKADKDGKISLTKEELQEMLDQAYNNGYADGLKPSYPIVTTTPTWYTTTASGISVNSTDVTL